MSYKKTGWISDPSCHLAEQRIVLDPSRRLIIGAGLLVAYMIDGDSIAAKGAHAELKVALAARDAAATKEAVRLLERVLVKERAEILAFAGLEESEGVK